MTVIKQKFTSWKSRRDFIGWWPDVLGALLFLLGLAGKVVRFDPWDISSELFGIGLAVLIIDNANQMLSEREEKKRLILQMGSPNNAFAVEAVRVLSERDWLFDGTLKGAHLYRANLSGADLISANLSGPT